jgi:hypothetical protein
MSLVEYTIYSNKARQLDTATEFDLNGFFVVHPSVYRMPTILNSSILNWSVNE